MMAECHDRLCMPHNIVAGDEGQGASLGAACWPRMLHRGRTLRIMDDPAPAEPSVAQRTTGTSTGALEPTMRPAEACSLLQSSQAPRGEEQWINGSRRDPRIGAQLSSEV